MMKKITRLFAAALVVHAALFTVACNKLDYDENYAKSYNVPIPVPQPFEGEDILGANDAQKFQITRNKSTKAASLTVAEAGEWAVFLVTEENLTDTTDLVLRGNTAGTFSLSVPTDSHSLFRVVTPDGIATITERQLPMSAMNNFRDIGGYRTKDGRYVKWGKILRCEAIDTKLSAADKDYLATLPLISVCDFRGVGSAAGEVTPSTVINKWDLPINSWDAGSTMFTINSQMVTKQIFIDQFIQLFEYLMDDENISLVFHCSAGKDRTGMAAALILFALGVDDETVLHDYMLTNFYQPGWTVERDWILYGLNVIDDDPNDDEITVTNFLTEKLGVDLDAFREKYLY